MTLSSKLHDLASTALKDHNGDVEAALPKFARAVQQAKLVEELARPYLEQQLAAMPADKAAGPGQSSAEPQTARAGAGSVKVAKYETSPHRRRTES